MSSWLKRLVPTGAAAAALTGVGWLLSFGPIAEDVSGRAAERLKAEGLGWAKVAIDGRDVTLTGVAPDEKSLSRAVEMADRVFGVRVVDAKATVPPIADPYLLGLTRDGDKVTLTGSVPSEAARAALVAALGKAMPKTTIEDRLSVARGAPTNFAESTSFAIGQLADLKKGSVDLAPAGYSIAGDPKDAATYQKLEAALKSAMPAGLKLVADKLVPPIADPYLFGLTRDGDKVTLTGSVPSEAARAALVAAIGKAMPKATIEDNLSVAGGAPANFVETATFAVGQLADLRKGSVDLGPAGYSIAGEPTDRATYQKLETALKSGLPAGVKLAADKLVAPIPAPYRFGLSTLGGKATIDGFLPDAATKAKILEAIGGRFTGGVVDKVEVVPGASAGFADTILKLLPGLSRLTDPGFEISGNEVSIKGGVLTEAIGRQILDRLKGLLPSGFTLAARGPTILPPPAVVDAAVCQALLAKLQSGEKILFETGKARLDERSISVLDALVGGSLACGTARITVEGHTDSDGDAAANQTLSEERAAAVVAYLVEAGISPQRLSAVGYGANRPVASNDTDEGKQQNRRIDFKVE